MSNACDTCGYRSSDIKAGGGVSEKGRHITLDVSQPDDLRRDIIKAESASICIPEADLEVTTGRLEAMAAWQHCHGPTSILGMCAGCNFGIVATWVD